MPRNSKSDGLFTLKGLVPPGGSRSFLRVDPSAAQLAICDSSLWDHIGLMEEINQVPVMVTYR